MFYYVTDIIFKIIFHVNTLYCGEYIHIYTAYIKWVPARLSTFILNVWPEVVSFDPVRLDSGVVSPPGRGRGCSRDAEPLESLCQQPGQAAAPCQRGQWGFVDISPQSPPFSVLHYYLYNKSACVMTFSKRSFCDFIYIQVYLFIVAFFYALTEPFPYNEFI